MAVVTVKSSQITNRDALPRVLNQARISGAEVRHKRAVVTITSGDSTGSIYILFDVPSRAIPVSLRISAPDIGTTTTADMGLYQTTANGGAVVTAAFFTAARILNAGPYTKIESVNGGTVTLTNGEKTLWECIGLAADPCIDYDVALTLVGAADATGLVLVELDYTL